MSNKYTDWDFYKLRSKIINDHLDKYPDAGSNTIAKILFRDFPEFFEHKEHARTLIRIRRGKKGAKARSKLKDKRYVKV